MTATDGMDERFRPHDTGVDRFVRLHKKVFETLANEA
jgi:hypothetical protein